MYSFVFCGTLGVTVNYDVITWIYVFTKVIYLRLSSFIITKAVLSCM